MNRAPRPVTLTPGASAYLDTLRALAAMAVLFDHWRALFYVGFADVSPQLRNVAVRSLYFLTAFGHQAVMAFFVLSGFFISSSVVRARQRGTWRWRDYAIDRAVRLYLVLLPGLLLGALWDFTGSHYFDHAGIYSQPLPAFGYGIADQRLNLSSFFGCLLFLQTRFTSVFGSNYPLWSLFSEFWYYVLFPVLVAAAIAAKRRSVTLAAWLGLAIVTVWILNRSMPGFVVWLAGSAVAVAPCAFGSGKLRSLRVSLYILLTSALAGICLWAARASQSWYGADIPLGLSFALVTYGIVHVPGTPGNAAIRLARTFAGFSFSLYVLHFPLLLFIRAALLPAMRWQPDATHLVLGAGIAAAVLFYAFALAHFTERKTGTARSWVRSLADI